MLFSVRAAKPFPTFAVAALVAALIAAALRIAWDPPGRTYLEYVPIGVVLAVLAWDRRFPGVPRETRAVLCDALVVSLALMRAVVPPLPAGIPPDRRLYAMRSHCSPLPTRTRVVRIVNALGIRLSRLRRRPRTRRSRFVPLSGSGPAMTALAIRLPPTAAGAMLGRRLKRRTSRRTAHVNASASRQSRRAGTRSRSQTEKKHGFRSTPGLGRNRPVGRVVGGERPAVLRRGFPEC